MGDDTALARAAISRLEFFRSERPEDVSVTRLGGLTNTVFKVDCNGESYVLRVPGQGTSDYIDRRVEAVAAREAARVGVSPAVVVADPVSGLMVTEHTPAAPMSAKLFRSVPGAARRTGETLRRLHTSGAKFDFRFDLFGMIDEYVRVLADHPGQLPPGLTDMLERAEELQQALAARPLSLTACHCDLLPENILDAGSRMWLVDWEYSGMGDPMWDLGDAAVECGLSPKEEQELLAGYFAGVPKPSEHGRIVIYKVLCDLLWTLWGLIQDANKNTADDFGAYANRRFERCKAIVADRGFDAHVAAVRQG